MHYNLAAELNKCFHIEFSGMQTHRAIDETVMASRECVYASPPHFSYDCEFIWLHILWVCGEGLCVENVQIVC